QDRKQNAKEKFNGKGTSRDDRSPIDSTPKVSRIRAQETLSSEIKRDFTSSPHTFSSILCTIALHLRVEDIVNIPATECLCFRDSILQAKHNFVNGIRGR
ncbi:hypothetical protein M441DRAFT_143339, partial [Trichoderma asperellum CBS 433.97]